MSPVRKATSVPTSVLDHVARAVITAAYVVETEYNDNVSPSLSALERCINLAVKKYHWRVSAVRFSSSVSGRDRVHVVLSNACGEKYSFIWRNFLND